ncbi:hypothetical protein BU25DRAFT_457682 [Macroventuria anomochaeta]|uniref:Uncharacterized protein n=1 Tax=Macroventuria anomochaeta TaxID=301207 RepID=A0ACB6S319_9PLEO|nr:uncharacterized protein BU25DRAFT_457682 [Macroventuria anomochaeta]KAF2628348.1 hypothetical protein BU25DRAFT_457682 [Macroventuria anomochaeta]
MPHLRRASLNVALDPHEPNPKVEVTKAIASVTEDPIVTTNSSPDNISPPMSRHRRNTQASFTDGNTTIPTASLSPRRPLAHISSAGSLTDTPTKHGHKISTIISKGDMKKWMETGTYGQEAPDDQGEGVEEHVVCMSEEDVKAGQASSPALGYMNEVMKEEETGGEADEAEEQEEGAMAESVVVGILVDRETKMADSIVVGMRCDQCGGQVMWAKTGDYATVCQKCREPQ